jgi:RNA polymerase sigma-70 factor (ECF subfamily)
VNSDQELMLRVAAGDAQAFRSVASAHLQPILRYCARLLRQSAEAEEVAQEVMLRAWQRAAEYEPKARLTTWLHRIAHNLAIDALRKRGHGTHELDDDQMPAPESGAPERLVERYNTAQRVQAALQSIPERQQQALILCHEQGFSNPEIAEVLGVGVAAVESLLSRGRKALRQQLTPALEPSHD